MAAFVMVVIRDGYPDALDDYVNVVEREYFATQSSSSAHATSQYRCSAWSSADIRYAVWGVIGNVGHSSCR
jgi:hypothetical protein